MKKDVNVAALEAEWLPEISSDFLLLDVKKGRKALNKMMSLTPAKTGRMRLLIEAEVDNSWGHDDGVSQEFALTVVRMEWVPE